MLFHSSRAEPRIYHDFRFDIKTIQLLPGDSCTVQEKMLLATTLGSCIAVCLRDPHSHIGGMNHFMLPRVPNPQGKMTSAPAFYGMYAMDLLINQLLKLGARRDRLEAKVFGGGKMLGGVSSRHIGQANAEFALEYLHTEKIPVLAEDLLDIYPRKVLFFPHNGDVLVTKLKHEDAQELLNHEKDYRKSIRQPPQGGVELL